MTEAAVVLSDADLIEYRWGKIWIRKRRGLNRPAMLPAIQNRYTRMTGAR